MSDDTPANWQPVCHATDLDGGQFAEFTVTKETEDGPASTGFVFKRDEQLHAYLNRCPHLGIELNWMPGRFLDSDGCFIQCSTHGALFLPEDGHCIAGPCQGDALTSLPVKQVGDTIEIRLPAAPE